MHFGCSKSIHTLNDDRFRAQNDICIQDNHQAEDLAKREHSPVSRQMSGEVAEAMPLQHATDGAR